MSDFANQTQNGLHATPELAEIADLRAKLQAAEERYEHVCAAWRGLADTIDPEGTMMAHDAARHLVEDRDRFKGAFDRMKSRAEDAEEREARLREALAKIQPADGMETNELIKLLRDQAQEIAKDGIDGWGNTMTLAADHLAELEAEVARMEVAVVDAHLNGLRESPDETQLRTYVIALEASLKRMDQLIYGDVLCRNCNHDMSAEPLEAQVARAKHTATEAALRWAWANPCFAGPEIQYLTRGLAALLGEG